MRGLADAVPILSWHTAWQVRQVQKQYSFDVIHAHDLFICGGAQKAGRRAGALEVADLHEAWVAVILQAILYAGAMSLLALSGQYESLSVGLIGFICPRWGNWTYPTRPTVVRCWKIMRNICTDTVFVYCLLPCFLALLLAPLRSPGETKDRRP